MLTWTTTQTTLLNNVVYTSVYNGNTTGRFTSLSFTTTMNTGAATSNFKIAVNLVGYTPVNNKSNYFLTFRYYLNGGDSCKQNSKCNGTALFPSGGVDSIGIYASGAYLYNQYGQATVNGVAVNASVLFQNGAFLVSYPLFQGVASYQDDPTAGVEGTNLGSPTYFLVDLQSTWWFGWTYTTWYIILAVVGVIVLLALVALIGAIIVWNRGKPGYEQV